MGIKITGNFDNIEKNIRNAAVESAAQHVAKVAREKGLTTTEKIDLSNDSGELDMAAVRRRAEEILGG